ncbi:MAG: hypothetical protein AAF222_08200 [Pseudomonadota bacterium]
MTRFQTFGLIGLCVLALGATVDSAFGLGGGALLADICRTVLEGDGGDAAMGDMQMEVKPVPLIALSLVATLFTIYAMSADHRRRLAGQSVPTEEERAAILSAMVVMAVAQGRTSREEMLDAFRIVTGHSLQPELAELAFQRSQALSEIDIEQSRLSTVSTHIGRRRTLAAALMLGCVARPATPTVASQLERIATDIGATSRDIQVARRALESWKSDCRLAQGVSPITVLRHRSLALSPS